MIRKEVIMNNNIDGWEEVAPGVLKKQESIDYQTYVEYLQEIGVTDIPDSVAHPIIATMWLDMNDMTLSYIIEPKSLWHSNPDVMGPTVVTKKLIGG